MNNVAKGPIHIAKKGALQVVVWEKSGKDSVFYTLQPVKRYHNKSQNKWVNSDSFAEWEADTIVDLIREAQDWIDAYKAGRVQRTTVTNRPRDEQPTRVTPQDIIERLGGPDLDDDDIPF